MKNHISFCVNLCKSFANRFVEVMQNVLRFLHINDFTTHGFLHRVFSSVSTGMPQSTRNFQTCSPPHAHTRVYG